MKIQGSDTQKKKKVLFICTGNSARSQMAEGLTRHLSKGSVEVHSAGLEPKGLNPYAIKVMDEIGINIRDQKSKEIYPALLNQADLIVTVCGNAEERCPVTPPGIQRLHWPLPDPAKATGSESEISSRFRGVRDEIRKRIESLLKEPGFDDVKRRQP
ncbi:MAG: arsenate reductase ArsC [Nitrospirae bacterium]|nr:arsenate reductase ArsC [Nitrospirota bacterium]MBI3351848.1 arsenate reductase ArsC [Nitrospirota bacterium]